MLVVPILLVGLAMLETNNAGLTKVAIVDYDNTKLTQELQNNLKDKCRIQIIDESKIRENLLNMVIDYAIVIDKGFTQQIIENKNAKLKTYSIQEANASAPVKLNIESYMMVVKNIAKACGGDSEKFYAGLESYKNSSLAMQNKIIEGSSGKEINTLAGIGFLVMCMLFLSSFAPMIILEDKGSKVFFRISSGPVDTKKYMLQNVLSFFAISLLQVIIILGYMVFIVKADVGPSVLNLFVVLAAFSLVCTSFGVAACSISKDMRQASLITTLLNTPMCMLGGCYWPRDFMPDILKKISEFSPATWVMRASEKTLFGSPLTSTLTEISVLLLFALVFFLLGSWRKADIAR
jgi:ABC-2 type transport system permease protein